MQIQNYFAISKKLNSSLRWALNAKRLVLVIEFTFLWKIVKYNCSSLQILSVLTSYLVGAQLFLLLFINSCPRENQETRIPGIG